MFLRSLVPLCLLLALGGPAVAQTATEFKGHQGLVFNVSFSPDGKTMATASFDGTVKLWDYATGKESGVLTGHTAPVYAVIFSPDGNTIATASQDTTIRLWGKDGTFQKELKGHAGVVSAIAFSPDGTLLASGSADKSVRLWDASKAAELKKLGDHTHPVYAVAFSPNGQRLASAGRDGFIKIWDVKEQKESQALETPLFQPEIIPVKPDEKLEAEAKKKQEEEARKRQAEEEKRQKQEAEKKKREEEERSKAGGLSPEEEKKKQEEEEKKKKQAEEKRLKAEEENRKREQEAKRVKEEQFRDGITAVVFGPDSTTLYSVGYDRHLRIWNVAEAKELKKIGPAPHDLFGLAISRDGKQVATAGIGGSIRVYDAASGKETFTKQLDKLITYSVTFAPDGKQLVIGTEKDNAARVVDIK